MWRCCCSSMYPTSTPDTTGSSTPSPNRRGVLRSEVCWTDDLPQCQLSDVGVAANVVYLADGRTTEAFPYEDRAFNLAYVCSVCFAILQNLRHRCCWNFTVTVSWENSLRIGCITTTYYNKLGREEFRKIVGCC